MHQQDLLFNEEQFNRLFPFYILIGENLCILSTGKSFQKVYSVKVGDAYSVFFKVRRPNIGIEQFSDLHKFANQMVVIDPLIDKTAPPLRGQFEYVPNANRFLFVGTPWFESMEQIKSANLNLDDFAIHDPMIDLLHVQKTHELANQELKELVQTTNRQKKELQLMSQVASLNENGVVFTNKEGKIIWTNEGFLQLTGYLSEEVIDKSPMTIGISALNEQKVIDEMLQKVEKGQSFQVELKHMRKNGSWFWAKIKGQSVLDKKGNILQHFATIEDITLEKERLAKEQELEGRLRFALEKIGDNVWEHDFETGKTIFSKSNLDFIGYSIDEFTNNASLWWNATHPDDKFNLEENDRKYKSGLIDHHMLEYRLLDREGNLHWVLDRGVLIEKTPEGKPLKIIGTHTDITERKNSEKELIKARELAESSSRTKQLFLANMSHEIRTPMNAIMGMGHQLQKTTLTEKQHFYLDVMTESAENLLVIINDILDISKIEAGKLTIESIGFEMNQVVKHAARVMQHKAEEKGLELFVTVDSSVSEVLLGDPYRLNQILLNLLSNAIKFTHKGKVMVSCKVLKNLQKEQLLEINITDEGIGMEKDFLEKLFQSFSQEDLSVTRKYGGTGLGMAISKQLVELMHGQIVAKSEKNKGTSILLNIPFSIGAQHDLPTSEIVTEDYSILENKKILLVEDNDMNRLVATTVLTHYHCNITECVNGQEAVDLISKEPFDLILMDIQMPVMDGIEATIIIRQEFQKKIPIIALSANAIKGENQKCMDAGMSDFITKPYSEEILVSTMAKWLGAKVTKRIIVEEKNPISKNKLYDITQLLLLSGDDMNFIHAMLNMFSAQIPGMLKEMEIAYAEKRLADLKDLAHKMKPTIDNLNMGSLKQTIRDLEAMCKTGNDHPEIPVLINEVKTTLEKLILQIKTDYPEK